MQTAHSKMPLFLSRPAICDDIGSIEDCSLPFGKNEPCHVRVRERRYGIAESPKPLISDVAKQKRQGHVIHAKDGDREMDEEWFVNWSSFSTRLAVPSAHTKFFPVDADSG